MGSASVCSFRSDPKSCRVSVIIAKVSIGVPALLTTSVLYQKLASDLPSVSDP